MPLPSDSVPQNCKIHSQHLSQFPRRLLQGAMPYGYAPYSGVRSFPKLPDPVSQDSNSIQVPQYPNDVPQKGFSDNTKNRVSAHCLPQSTPRLLFSKRDAHRRIPVPLRSPHVLPMSLFLYHVNGFLSAYPLPL